ncbi:ABC transporter ATP-binding protein [Microvirga makkahensis]|uniref:ATP-binding cassette domain-containing protein n=1 Tax=Microvirga makkahensis TaxID=1128670 RepID=A0A7X3SQT2_9HYPH|nr:ABC transporter ATP-binding protein [Microvirga makkahensis]MXQ13608.1 ATP-binding cassette domain-containing protein [Microvirga makkahensis]
MSRLELNRVSAFYGDAQALFDIDLVVEPGEIVAIIGSNGAGKTTVLRTISGLVKPREGTLRYDGRDIAAAQPWSVVASGIAHVPEGRRLFREMSVQENLMMGAYHRNNAADGKTDLERVYTLFPRLAERRDQLAGTMSGGEQQMAAIGRALMARPRLLLLDEPSLGLAPKIIETVFDTIREINAEGVGIILVEQSAQLALETAGRAYLMENGRVVKTGSSSDLMTDDAVREAYLGL